MVDREKASLYTILLRSAYLQIYAKKHYTPDIGKQFDHLITNCSILIFMKPFKDNGSCAGSFDFWKPLTVNCIYIDAMPHGRM